MPKDQLNCTAPASPQRYVLSDMRVAVFMRLLPDSSMVKMAFANNHSTHVPTIDGREVVKLAKELTIAEWWNRGLAAHYGRDGRVKVPLQHRFIKIVPSAFANYVGGRLASPSRRKREKR